MQPAMRDELEQGFYKLNLHSTHIKVRNTRYVFCVQKVVVCVHKVDKEK